VIDVPCIRTIALDWWMISATNGEYDQLLFGMVLTCLLDLFFDESKNNWTQAQIPSSDPDIAHQIGPRDFISF